jgi:hypothetical protein
MAESVLWRQSTQSFDGQGFSMDRLNCVKDALGQIRQFERSSEIKSRPHLEFIFSIVLCSKQAKFERNL